MIRWNRLASLAALFVFVAAEAVAAGPAKGERTRTLNTGVTGRTMDAPSAASERIGVTAGQDTDERGSSAVIGKWVEPGVDRPGFDYREFRLLGDDAVCRKACADDARCKAYTYVKPGTGDVQARCLLKSAVPKAKASACCISGVKPELSASGTGTVTSPAQVPEPMGDGGKDGKYFTGRLLTAQDLAGEQTYRRETRRSREPVATGMPAGSGYEASLPERLPRGIGTGERRSGGTPAQASGDTMKSLESDRRNRLEKSPATGGGSAPGDLRGVVGRTRPYEGMSGGYSRREPSGSGSASMAEQSTSRNLADTARSTVPPSTESGATMRTESSGKSPYEDILRSVRNGTPRRETADPYANLAASAKPTRELGEIDRRTGGVKKGTGVDASPRTSSTRTARIADAPDGGPYRSPLEIRTEWLQAVEKAAGDFDGKLDALHERVWAEGRQTLLKRFQEAVARMAEPSTGPAGPHDRPEVDLFKEPRLLGDVDKSSGRVTPSKPYEEKICEGEKYKGPPVITGMLSASAKNDRDVTPGDTIIISGENFSKTPGKVYLLLPREGMHPLSIPLKAGVNGDWSRSWYDGMIIVEVPRMKGVYREYPARLQVWVKHPCKQNHVYYHMEFKPRMVLTRLSGLKYLELSKGEEVDNAAEKDGVLLVTHDPGCSDDGLIESGDDMSDFFFRKASLPAGFTPVKSYVEQLPRDADFWMAVKALGEWLLDGAEDLLTGNFLGFAFDQIHKFVAPLFDPNVGKYGLKVLKRLPPDTFTELHWYNTCFWAGQHKGHPLVYTASFMVLGPEGAVPSPGWKDPGVNGIKMEN